MTASFDVPASARYANGWNEPPERVASPEPAPEGDTRPRMSGASALVHSLIAEGVDLLFGYPGGAIMPVYDALYDVRDRLRHVLVRHEQGAVHAAQGYARATGKVGVCIATSGPGATNLVTGIADAQIDSTPIVCITGQVFASLLGTDAFQETDVLNVTAPITKWNVQVTRAADLPGAVDRRLHRRQLGFQIAVDVLDHHDRVIHHEADGDDDRHQRQIVDRIAKRPHRRASAGDRQRHGHARRQHHGRAAQEHEHLHETFPLLFHYDGAGAYTNQEAHIWSFGSLFGSGYVMDCKFLIVLLIYQVYTS